MTGYDKDLLQLKKREVKALERANELKVTELEILKLQIACLTTDKRIDIAEHILNKLNEIQIR